MHLGDDVRDFLSVLPVLVDEICQMVMRPMADEEVDIQCSLVTPTPEERRYENDKAATNRQTPQVSFSRWMVSNCPMFPVMR